LSKRSNKKGLKTRDKKGKIDIAKSASQATEIGSVKSPVPKNRSSIHITYLHFLPLSISLLVFIIVWSNPLKIKVMDPWYKGAILIDSARNVMDTNQRNILMEQAGKKLAEQIRLHPYHARVHFLYGYYWFNRQNWDSVIYQQKEAIRIGAGGIVNQIEYNAQEMLNAALDNKVTPLINTGQYNEALVVLENAKTPNMINPGIDKNKGVIFSRQGNSDSALACFIRYKQSNPNDANNLANIGISYLQKNNRDSARKYINDALKIDPNNANAQQVKAQLIGQ
jgi:tetratricopeptide (TPR) repeat protein